MDIERAVSKHGQARASTGKHGQARASTGKHGGGEEAPTGRGEQSKRAAAQGGGAASLCHPVVLPVVAHLLWALVVTCGCHHGGHLHLTHTHTDREERRNHGVH